MFQEFCGGTNLPGTENNFMLHILKGAQMNLSDRKMCPFSMFLCLSPCLSLYFSTEYKIK